MLPVRNSSDSRVMPHNWTEYQFNIFKKRFTIRNSYGIRQFARIQRFRRHRAGTGRSKAAQSKIEFQCHSADVKIGGSSDRWGLRALRARWERRESAGAVGRGGGERVRAPGFSRRRQYPGPRRRAPVLPTRPPRSTHCDARATTSHNTRIDAEFRAEGCKSKRAISFFESVQWRAWQFFFGVRMRFELGVYRALSHSVLTLVQLRVVNNFTVTFDLHNTRSYNKQNIWVWFRKLYVPVLKCI